MNVTDGSELKAWALIFLGNIFIVVFAVRAIGAYAKKEWGELVTNFLAAIFIAGIVYANDQTIALLKAIWGMVVGQG